MPLVWSACSCVYKTLSIFLILLSKICFFISGDVSISIDRSPFLMCAEHLVRMLNLFFLFSFPQLFVIQGDPSELPHPRIVNFVSKYLF